MAKGSSSTGGGIELPTFTSPSKAGAHTTTYRTDDGDDVPEYASGDGDGDGHVKSNVDGLQRHLTNRQIQMIAIGGSIGTALFVSIGYGLIEGGPGNLLLGFTIYSLFLSLVNSCVAEMTVYMPVSGGFVRLGGKVSSASDGVAKVVTARCADCVLVGGRRFWLHGWGEWRHLL